MPSYSPRTSSTGASTFLGSTSGSFEVLGAAGDIGVAIRAAGTSVVFVIHGPDVVPETGEDVHHRVFALARRCEIKGRAPGVGRSVNQQQHGQRFLARLGSGGALAEHVKLDVAFLRPVFVGPGFARRSVFREGFLRLAGRALGQRGGRSQQSSRHHAAARYGLARVLHDFTPTELYLY